MTWQAKRGEKQEPPFDVHEPTAIVAADPRA